MRVGNEKAAIELKVVKVDPCFFGVPISGGVPISMCRDLSTNHKANHFSMLVWTYESLFTHGQFYVAVSRATDVKNCMILTHPESNERVLNVVFPEVLRRR